MAVRQEKFLPKSRTSYADLLELYLQKPEQLTAIAHTLGFIRTAEKPQESKTDETNKQPVSRAELANSQAGRSQPPSTCKDRPMLPFYYIAHRERLEHHINPQRPEQPEWLERAKILEDDDIYDSQAQYPRWQALTRPPQLWAKLRQILKQQYRTEEPDTEKLIKYIQRGDSFKQFPYQKKQRRVSQLLVLADYAMHLRTSRQDYQQLHQALKAYWGEANISWQGIEDYPRGIVSFIKNKQYQQQKWRIPEANTAVLILSDCASLGNKEQQPRWQQLLKELRQAGNISLILAPAAAQDIQIKAKGAQVFSWEHQLQRVGSHPTVSPNNNSDSKIKAVETLLTALAFTYTIEPSLLRAMRQFLTLNVSCEAYCRQHEDVIDDKTYLTIKPEAQAKYRDQFRLLATPQQDQIIQIVTAHHAPLVRSILNFELDTVQALRPNQPVTGGEDARYHQQCLAKTFADKTSDHTFRSYVYHLINEQESGGEVGALFFCSYHKKTIEAEGLAGLQLPKQVTLQHISQFIEMTQPTKAYVIQQQAKQLLIEAQNVKAIDLNSFSVANTESSQKAMMLQPQKVLIKQGSTFSIPTGKNSVSLDTGTELFTLSTLIKPDWADTIGRDQQGLFIEAEHLGAQVKIYYPPWGGSLEKDQYGLYTELKVREVVQRFRYISAGAFLMGSPDTETDRESNETQHKVTLSQAYWLADTACTQELWQAVMGGNPANFNKDKQNPVEQVSWDNVQTFLKKLNTLIPQLKALLPTEAQWEYACRAGTETPFYFGDNITTEQVNYDGNRPYAKGKKGKYRKETTAVKALAENQWGLYQMHGNVWEWCQDGYGAYPEEATIDPVGAKKGELRVLRGGSWIGYGQGVRSALRGRRTPDNLSRSMGFRFSLGQAVGEAVAERVQVSDQSVVRAEPQRSIGREFIKQAVDKFLDLVQKGK